MICPKCETRLECDPDGCWCPKCEDYWPLDNIKEWLGENE